MNNIKTLLSTGLMAFAAVAVHAQSIPDIGGLNNQTAGDLVLGFSNAASANDLVVDIGPASDYYSTQNALASSNNAVAGGLIAGDTYTVSAYNSADLATVMGSNQYSASTRWAVVGGNGNDGGPSSESTHSIWATSAGAALTNGSYLSQATLSGNLDAMNGNMFGATPLASEDATTLASSTGLSFTSLLSPSGTFNSGLNAVANGTTAALATAGTSTLTLYELLPNNVGPLNGTVGSASAIDLGYFTLSDSALTFTVAAIPEPSTYAAILGALTIGFVMIRRRARNSGLIDLA